MHNFFNSAQTPLSQQTPTPCGQRTPLADISFDATPVIYDKLRKILDGQESVKLYLEFLKRNNKVVDMLVLRNTKDILEAQTSIYHTAPVTLQNTFMHAGTTSDVFLHENLEWLGLASNWAKFSTTATLGVIHKGYFEEGMNILGPYLPQAGGESQIQGAAFSEGGALYALGLINAGCSRGQPVENYLHETMKTAHGEVVQHVLQKALFRMTMMRRTTLPPGNISPSQI
ncbi:hypothetical protein DEU56DRAFT_330402 [Suillus clintonianus]|uniref:uncharacterized protein n=1 Tax=Suillus clintonianus TaxID=1904413 RepID=UPI001B86E4A0|nr:uncharacterized protein DEU56DRAFT_330402 [Suillus clintonianus]KAG2138982.1 hypothetical protein DEU56DRAFT_330402 [Suillus clintonianus]